MYSTKLSVSVHILCMIALRGRPAVTSEDMAASVQTNPAVVRRLMSRLKKAGLIRTRPRVGAVGLAKPSGEISLWDIFRTVEPERLLFDLHTGTNLQCPVGANIRVVMAGICDKMQAGFETQLKSIYLSDILRDLKERGVTSCLSQ